MVAESKNARVFIEFFAKQKVAKPFESRLFVAAKFCSEVVPINFLYHVSKLTKPTHLTKNLRKELKLLRKCSFAS